MGLEASDGRSGICESAEGRQASVESGRKERGWSIVAPSVVERFCELCEEEKEEACRKLLMAAVLCGCATQTY